MVRPGFGRGPFVTFGLPFTLMTVGAFYVLTSLREEKYRLSDRAPGRRPTAQQLSLPSLQADLEVRAH